MFGTLCKISYPEFLADTIDKNVQVNSLLLIEFCQT